MDRLRIYHQDGRELTDAVGRGVEVLSVEDNDKWMGEHSVDVSVSSPFPIGWCIGDYIDYRGERFEINYEPGRIKSSRAGSDGGAFVYNNVKFDSKQYELVRSEFLDVVLYDNGQHYTSLPKFAFYASSLDDIADRIQANLNEQYGDGVWQIYTRNKAKSLNRGCDAAEWSLRYGDGVEDNVIKAQSISVSSQSCWDVLSLVNSTFDVNFITRGRSVYIGTAGIPADHIFGYGKGNGLRKIEEQTDSSQAVTTRLRAYGSSKNLPTRYYTNLCLDVFTKCTGGRTYLDDGETRMNLVLYTDIAWENRWAYFSTASESGSFPVSIRVDRYDYDVKANKTDVDGKELLLFYVSTDDGNDYYNCQYLSRQYSSFPKIYITKGASKENWPAQNKEYQSDALPNNMSINVLMLPGFPKKSLKEWWDAQDDATKKRIGGDREHDFSQDRFRPYVDSLNAKEIGVRQSSLFFDNDNEKEGIIEIYPTIEEMEVGGVRIDEIDEGSVSITDNGVFADGATIPPFTLKLKKEVNFDINSIRQNDFSVSMKDGMCAGRTFKVGGSAKGEDGRWVLTMERVKDEDLGLYFPYKDFQIKKGDHFVLSGIELPDEYVEYSAEKLLTYAIAWLDENDHTQKVYTPQIDNVYMARQHDSAEADESGMAVSLYKSLRAGDMLTFADDDLGLSVTMTIDQLTIKESGGKIPEYTITLKKKTDVGTIQRIENKIDSLVSGNGLSGGGGLLEPQIKQLIKSYGSTFFLSKLKEDAASGLIRFQRGIAIGKKYGVTEGGDAQLSSVSASRVSDGRSTSADRVITGASGYDVYMGDDGKSYAYLDNIVVRQKAVFAETEIRKVSYAGGSVTYSNAGSSIVKVDYLTDATGSVSAIKCYAKADDGTTQTANWWRVGMMALCKTYNIKNSGNRYYWRLVTGTGTEMLDDGMEYYYVVLSNVKEFKGSDAIIPSYGEGVFSEENGNLLTWGDGSISIAITTGCGNVSIASVSDETEDDNGVALGEKTFYGYDPSVGNDLPAVGDVIVQAGDQIRWMSRGNVVMVRTSSEDDGGDTAPSIMMYYSMGAPYATGKKDEAGNDIATPYQWKRRTAMMSPGAWLVNAKRFKFFTDDDESRVVEPIATTYEIKVSSDTLTIHQDGTTTPNQYTMSVVKHYGSLTETVEGAKIYGVLTADENKNDVVLEYGSPLWPMFVASLKLAKALRFEAYINGDRNSGEKIAEKHISVTRDGADGENVNMVGSADDAIVDSEAPSGDGVHTWEELLHYGFEPKVGGLYLFYMTDETGSKAQVVRYSTATQYTIEEAKTGDSYVVDNADSVKGVDGILFSCYAKDADGNTDWRDMGVWRGRDGVTITAEPGALVFDTGVDGLVDMGAQTGVISNISAQRGGEAVAVEITQVTGTGCTASASGTTVKVTAVDKQTIVMADGTEKTMSVGGGYIGVDCMVGGAAYHVTIPMTVNIAAYAGKVEWDAKEYNATFTKYKKTTDGRLEKAESSIKQNADAISLKVSCADMEAAGMDITADSVVLTATQTLIRNQQGETVAVFNADGTMIAGTVKTADTGFGSVSISGGEIGVTNPQGKTNIRFGLTSDGFMVLQYYDNDGNLLYDLGPSGLTQSAIVGQKWYSGQWVAVALGTDMASKCLWSDGTWHDAEPLTATGLSCRWYKMAIGNLATAAFTETPGGADSQPVPPTGNQPKWTENGYQAVALHKYYAAKINDTAVADDAAGLSAKEAALADGKWFTQKTGLGDGTGGLQHEAEGLWLPWDGTVLDGVGDAGNVYYPTYRLTGLMTTVMGSEQQMSMVVSEKVSKTQGTITR